MNDPHRPWADLHVADSRPDETTFTIVGLPYDGGASARKGAALGPEHIRRWSAHLTPVSEDRTRLSGLSVCDLGDLAILDPAQDFERVRELIAGLPNLPILLGGDHSVTIPVLQAQRQRFAGRRLGVLWVDAHADLCDEFMGSRLSHACVLRRGVEAGIQPEDMCLVGLRSWEEAELELIESGRFHVYPMTEIAERGMGVVAADVRRVLEGCAAVHISLDIDCLDPSAAPGTGIPDAGGLAVREVLTLIKALQGLPLAGLDVVEVAPPLDRSGATVFAALKILLEFMGVIARNSAEGGRQPAIEAAPEDETEKGVLRRTV